MAAARASGGEMGELTIRDVAPLDAAQRLSMRQLVATEPAARRHLKEVEQVIAERKLLDAGPQPLAEIHYEGLLNTDPRRQSDVCRLREMDDVAVLVRHWQLTGEEATAAALRRFLEAWAATYIPTGNDVNENKLYPLFVAYHGLRESFPADSSEKVDAWIARLADLHLASAESSRVLSNRFTKRLRLLAVFSRILGRPDLQIVADEGTTRFVTGGLYPDGSSFDLKARDSLTYHCSALEPLLDMARLRGEEGIALYSRTSQSGASIRASVDFVMPYARGDDVREEWKQTTVELDRRRAASGIEKYRPGRLFEPREAQTLSELASFFDPKLILMVAKLLSLEDPSFATWILLENEAIRRARQPASREENRPARRGADLRYPMHQPDAAFKARGAVLQVECSDAGTPRLPA